MTTSDQAREQPLPTHRWRTDAASRLGDVTSCLRDLLEAEAALVALITGWPEESGVPVEEHARSLWVHAIISYTRCFSGGIRQGVRVSLLEPLGADAIEFHRYLVLVRDKHIAHSANDQEQTRVEIVMDPADETPIAVSTLLVHQPFESRATTVLFKQLVRDAVRLLEIEDRRLRDEVLQEARDANLDRLRRLERAKIIVPGLGTRARSRKRA